jgi:hypothetical protein
MTSSFDLLVDAALAPVELHRPCEVQGANKLRLHVTKDPKPHRS